ncbi:MAG: hypothetical protein IV100_00155 [Myxococcales bacterium]|nr:hypothetical protein [Myxococcales bacterium]
MAKPDLVIAIPEWTLVPGTARVQFKVTVQNKSTDIADMSDVSYISPACVDCGVDVLLFPNLPSAPVTTDYTPLIAALPAIMAPNQLEEFGFEFDFEVPGAFSAWALVDSIAFDPQLASFSYAVTKEAQTANNRAGPTSGTVPALAGKGPDLRVESIVAQASGTQVKYTAVVKNGGTEASPATAKVDVMVDAPGGVCPPAAWLVKPVSLDAIGDVFVDVPALAPGATTSVDLLIKLAPGTHTGCAMVDLEGLVEETDENNNIGGPVSVTVTSSSPDCPNLDVSLLNVGVSDADVTFAAKVKNLGAKASGPTTANLFFNSITAPVEGQVPDFIWTLPALAPGEEVSLTPHVEKGMPNAERQAWLLIDGDGAGTGCSVENNLEGPFPYEVAAAAVRPDLSVKSIQWQPSGTSLCYEIEVENDGTLDAASVDVDIFFSLEVAPTTPNAPIEIAPADYVVIPALAAGETTTVSVCWNSPLEGEHLTWVVLDFLGNVTELDETNNVFGPEVVSFVAPVTAGPDLVVVDFDGFVRCTLIDYAVKVCNVGDVAAQHFAVDVYYDAPENPGFNGTKYGLGDKTVFYGSEEPGVDPGLAAGDCLDIVIQREESPSGTYQSWIVVDTSNEIGEGTEVNPLGEGNNIAFVNLVVDAEGCVCEPNSEIDAPCACGSETVTSGYCCNGDWQPDEFDVCIPEDQVGDGDGNPDSDNPGGDDVGGNVDGGGPDSGGDGGIGPYAATDLSSGVYSTLDEGCSAAPSGRGAGRALLLVGLVVAIFGFGRFKSSGRTRRR